MIPLSDLRLMLVKVSPLGVSGDKIKAELQMAERLDMLEGCGEMPLHPPSVAGTFYFGSRMSALGPGRVKTFFLPQKLHAAGRNPRRRDRLSLFLLYRVRSQSGRNLAPRRTT
jgi:hypothetical protein